MADFDELNALLLAACTADDVRVVARMEQAIGVRRQRAHPFACCVSREVTLNGYGTVTFETNRYSIPADKACKHLTLRAYPFAIELLADNQVIATHKRCYGRHQDILDPLHYLALVAQRPGAFEHAQPLREWRAEWPPVYETLLVTLRQQHPNESAAIRTFVQILELHQRYAPDLMQAAIEQAVRDHLTTPAGVRFCLDRLLDPTPTVAPLDLAEQPELATVGCQVLSSARYDQFLTGASA